MLLIFKLYDSLNFQIGSESEVIAKEVFGCI